MEHGATSGYAAYTPSREAAVGLAEPRQRAKEMDGKSNTVCLHRPARSSGRDYATWSCRRHLVGGVRGARQDARLFRTHLSERTGGEFLPTRAVCNSGRVQGITVNNLVANKKYVWARASHELITGRTGGGDQDAPQNSPKKTPAGVKCTQH